jgi:hypothetical protein
MTDRVVMKKVKNDGSTEEAILLSSRASLFQINTKRLELATEAACMQPPV